MSKKKYNFGAGPCILPDSVLNSASDAVKDYNRTGLSILEISHRSSEFEKIINECEDLVRELLKVPADYSILFLQGGASTQFSMVPMCLMQPHKGAVYLDTGYFSLKAIKEARMFGPVQVVASSKDRDYDYIPVGYHIPGGSAYFHCTSNNSIEGTEIFDFPETDVPVVCDMSSDIFSREINVANFGLIYAGAQKNMGPAGLTLVIVKKALLKGIENLIPSMSDYRIYNDHNSMFNTPPVFSIYVAMLNLRRLKEMGGIKRAEETNIAKAKLLYDAIDSSECFYGLADKADRSRMNITFKMYNREREPEFLNFAESRGVVGIGGFSSVGGFRASLYNAMDMLGVEFLVQCMNDFIHKDLFKNFKLKQI